MGYFLMFIVAHTLRLYSKRCDTAYSPPLWWAEVAPQQQVGLRKNEEKRCGCMHHKGKAAYIVYTLRSHILLL